MIMRNFLPLLFAVMTLLACKQKATSVPTDTEATEVADTAAERIDRDHAVSPEQLIAPGKGIGRVQLDDNLNKVMGVLGRPDATDAAMGSQLATWYAKHDSSGYKTTIFAQRNMGGKDEEISHIKKILITSPWFKTADYISTGHTKAEIEKHYTLKEGNTYKATNGETITIYNDLPKGVAFEIDPSDQCVGIVVLAPNSVADSNINLH